MSFVISPGVIQTPLTAGGVAYGNGTYAKVTAAGTTGQALISAGASVPVFGVLGPSGGGTGVSASLTGYLYGNGTSAVTASTTIPFTDTTGTVAVSRGGSGATSLTGYLYGNGTSAFTSSTTIPFTDTTGTVDVSRGGTGATSLTSNNVLLGNGTSAVNFVAPGANGNVLTSNGTTWTSAAAGGGSWIFLSNVAASGATTVDIDTTFSSTYDMYAIVAPQFTLSGSPTNSELKCRLKIGGVYNSSLYMYASNITSGSVYVGQANTNNDSIYLTTTIGPSSTYPNASMSLIIYVPKPADTSLRKSIFWLGGHTFGNNPNQMGGQGWYDGSNAALTGVRLLFTGGATFSGNFRLYGIKNS